MKGPRHKWVTDKSWQEAADLPPSYATYCDLCGKLKCFLGTKYDNGCTPNEDW